MAKKRAATSSRDWLESLRAYSSLEHSDAPRAREVRAMPWGEVPGMGARFNKRWLSLLSLVERFDAGTIIDPCPTAMHYGSRVLRADVERATHALNDGRWVEAKCAASTANAFFAVRKAKVRR